MMKEEALVKINVEIEEEGLKRLIKEGKLVAFIDTLPAMMAGTVKAQLVESLVASAGTGGNASMQFVHDDFPTGPRPGPWPGPWPWADIGNPAVTMLSFRNK